MSDSLARHDDYDGPPFDESLIDRDPVVQLCRWLGDAEAAGLPDANAMVLGTVDPDGAPSSRTVLLKGLVGPDGPALEFVTNGESRKGVALASEQRVTLLFPWYALRRQVIVDGIAHPAPAALSDEYWATRPRGSQIGGWASRQSRPAADRAELERAVAAAEARFAGVDAVPRPPHWGAWFVEPRSVEFWQGRPSRLHDRLVLERDDSVEAGWRLLRRQP